MLIPEQFNKEYLIELLEMIRQKKKRLSTILEKSKEADLEFYKRTAKVLQNIQIIEYCKVNFKLPDSQLNKLKSAVKNRQGLTLRMNIKMVN